MSQATLNYDPNVVDQEDIDNFRVTGVLKDNGPKLLLVHCYLVKPPMYEVKADSRIILKTTERDEAIAAYSAA